MPLAAFPPSVRLKEHQTKYTSLILTERLQYKKSLGRIFGAETLPGALVVLRRNQTVKTSVNHLFLVAFCPFGDYPFAPRHFPKVRGVARATIISLSDLVLVGACIHR